MGSRQYVRRWAAALTGVTIIACAETPRQPTEPSLPADTVYADGLQFLPTYVQIKAGQRILFDIVPAPDGTGHDVTFRTGQPGAPPNIPVTLTARIERLFAVAGSFPYDCSVHPGMSGQIEVR